MYRVRGLDSFAKQERDLFQRIVYGKGTCQKEYNSNFDQIYMAFLTSRVSKDARLDGKVSKVRDCGGVDLQVFKGDNLEHVLARYECAVEGYYYVNGDLASESFPIESTAVYVSLNIRHTERATKEMILEVLKRKLNKLDIGKKCDIRRYLMKYSVRGWNMIDMDMPSKDDLIILKAIMDHYCDEFFVIKTKGGYHWIFHNQCLKEVREGDGGLHLLMKAYIDKGYLKSIDFGGTGMINNNGFTVVPGTIQRGHKVYFVRELCKGLENY